MLDGDNELTGNKKFTREQKLENGKGKCNVGVCCHCWKQDTSKKVNAMLVFAVIVGEQDTSKKVNAMLVFVVIVGKQDTSKR